MSELTLSGHFKNLAQISEFIATAATNAGLDERSRYGIQMAVDEACTNIIEHGYGGNDKGQIRLVCEVESRGLRVIIYNHGRSFDPQTVAIPNVHAPVEERSTRGMGLFLTRKLVDELEFKFNTPEGHQLILFKRRE
jgi:serine/threonine-protein kinase RsbW